MDTLTGILVEDNFWNLVESSVGRLTGEIYLDHIGAASGTAIAVIYI